MKKTIFIISGPNGAGKTTFAMSSLKTVFGILDFVNADEIAKGLSPLNPESVALSAGKIMLNRVAELLKNDKSFAIETTLAGKNYAKFIKSAKVKGYKIFIIFLWLDSHKTAIRRVAERVKKGGHNVADNVVKNRYKNGLSNLIHIYMDIADITYIIDNTSNSSDIFNNMIAEKASKNKLVVYNKAIWSEILNYVKKRN